MRVRLAVALALFGTVTSVPCPAQETASVTPLPGPKPNGPTGFATGTVYCADTNAPARLAQIYLVPASLEKSVGSFGRMGVVDLDGHFAVGNLPEGKYYLAAHLAGYLNPMGNIKVEKLASMHPEARKAAEARLIAVTVSAKQPAEIAVRLERAAEIDGTVSFDDGSPAIGLQMTIDPKPGKDEKPNPADTFQTFSEDLGRAQASDDHGHFRIVGVGPGEYLISARVPAFSGEVTDSLAMFARLPYALGALNVYYGNSVRASKAKVVKIEAAGSAVNADITIPLSKLHTIRGHMVLKSTGDPPPAGAVMLQYADTSENARMALVNESGEFSFYYVPEGNYVLAARASPEPLPHLTGDGDEDSGFLVSGFEVPIGDKAPDGAGAMPLLVAGDVGGITLTVPDPPLASSKEGASPAASENPAAPPSPPRIKPE